MKYYNLFDVQPLHDAIKNVILFYKHEKIDLLKQILTLSGAANKIFHKFNRCEAIFRFGERHKTFYNLVRKQILGGPSLVFSRYEKVNESSIGEDENNLVKTKLVMTLMHYVCMQLVEIYLLVPIQLTNPFPVTDFSHIDILFN